MTGLVAGAARKHPCEHVDEHSQTNMCVGGGVESTLFSKLPIGSTFKQASMLSNWRHGAATAPTQRLKAGTTSI